MLNTLRRITRGLVIAGLMALFSASIVAAEKSDDPMRVKVHKLKNGLTVYLTAFHERPRFYAEIMVRAGSKHDPHEATGLAHYLEHLLFKGTDQFGTIDYAREKIHLDKITELYEKRFAETDPQKREELYTEISKATQLASQFAIPNEFDRAYRELGGTEINAHTWVEETVYNVELPSNRLEQWARVEAERFRHPVLRLFQPELEIVYEEKNRSLDDKDRLVGETIGKLLFKKHPYGQQTTLGSVEHLKNPSLKHIYDYYATHYVPANMAIAISGDIQIPEAIEVIEKYFGAWEAKPLPAQKSWEEEPLKGVERATVQYPGEEFVQIGVRLPGQNHPDASALKMVDMIMDNSAAGLINLNLNQKQKVRKAGSYPMWAQDYGVQYFYGIPKEGQPREEVEKLLLGELERIKKGEIEDWIIPAIITDYKKSYMKNLESNEARVELIRDAFIAFQDWDVARTEIARMERLTKADIVRVANKYFGDSYAVVHRVDGKQEIPSIEKPKLEKIDIDASRQSNFMKEVLALPDRPIEPTYLREGHDFRLGELGKGVDFGYAANPVNDLFTLTLNIDLGTRQEPRLGLASELLDKSGTEQLAAADLKKEWYKLGTDFSFVVGETETAISISGLKENLEASLDLLYQLLGKPKADQADLDKLAKIYLGRRADEQKDFMTILRATNRFNMWGPKSSYLGQLTSAQISNLKADELMSLVSGLLSYRLRVSYTGTLPYEKVTALLDSRHPRNESLKEPPPYPYLEVRESKGNEIYFFHKEMAQSMTMISFGDEKYQESRYPPGEIFNDYFSGGMNSVVFQELREARALAYVAWSGYIFGTRQKEQNYMLGYIGSQADKTLEALDVFIKLLDEPPVSDDRFSASRTAVINRYRTSKIGFRSILPSIREWSLLGLKDDPRVNRFEIIQKLNLKDMVQFHEKHIKGRPKLISVVGDKMKIDMEKLATYGTIREVTKEEIFVTE